MEWDVVDVQPVLPMALQVRFADGTAGQVRFESSHLTGVFAALKDPALFAQARIEAGASRGPVTWTLHQTRCTQKSSHMANGFCAETAVKIKPLPASASQISMEIRSSKTKNPLINQGVIAGLV